MPAASSARRATVVPSPRALHRSVIPIIVIAEDGVHPEGRLETGEHGRPFIGRNESRDIPVTRDVIAKQDGDVSAERVGMFDNRLDMLQRHPGIAGMKSATTAILSFRSAGHCGGET